MSGSDSGKATTVGSEDKDNPGKNGKIRVYMLRIPCTYLTCVD